MGYWDGSKWRDDPKMEYGKPSLPCMAVNVELSGDAKKRQSKIPGRYVVVEGMWKRGRQVWKQESSPHRFLTVQTGFSHWGISNTVKDRSVYIASASAATSCPASPSNSKNKRLGLMDWRYVKNKRWFTGNIIVTCETPNRCL